MVQCLVLLVAFVASTRAWGLAYDTTGVYPVAERTVNIPTLPGGSTSTMSNSKIYYPSDGTGGVAAGAAPCPIVVFGHGFNISIDQYVSYGRHLASWGYVAVIPTISNPFPTPSHYGRAIDMKAAARYAAGLDTTAGDAFSGRIDRWRWGFAGHSMGGSIACLAADTLRMTDTLRCVVSFSGPQSTPAAHPAHILAPLLVLEATNDNIAPWHEVYTGVYRGGSQPATFAVINGGNHSQFTDGWTSPMGDGSASISRGLQRRYARRHLTAWLERYLKGSRAPLNYRYCFGDSVNGHAAMADTVASRYQNLAPLAPVPGQPFDFACLGTRQPPFTWRTDDDIDQLQHRLYLDDDAGLSSPDSVSAGNGASGETSAYAWPTPLPHGAVYYWRARARDNAGLWGPACSVRSLTLDTTLPANACSWRQSRAGQFSAGTLSGLTLSGDSVVPSGASPGVLIGPEADYRWLSSYGTRSGWGYFKWRTGAPDDSVALQVEYRSGTTWQPVPDAALPGNSAWFAAAGEVSLWSLDTLTYRFLRLRARIAPGAKSDRPALLAWELGSPISSPLGVSAEQVTAAYLEGSVILRWRAEPDPDRYQWSIERAGPVGGFSLLQTIAASGESEHRYQDRTIPVPGRYWYRLCDIRADGTRLIWDAVAVDCPAAPGTDWLRLWCASPEAGGAIRIGYQLPLPGRCRLSAYNLAGQRVALIADRESAAGSHQALWNAAGNAPGAYLLCLEACGRRQVRRVVLVR